MVEQEGNQEMTLITGDRKLLRVSVGFDQLQKLFQTSIINGQSGEPINYRFHDDTTGRTLEVSHILITLCSFPIKNN